MKNLIKRTRFAIYILLTCVLCVGCSFESKPTEYDIKRDSLNYEFDFAHEMFSKYDSLFYVEQKNSNVLGMALCNDSARYYLQKMVKEYTELTTLP